MANKKYVKLFEEFQDEIERERENKDNVTLNILKYRCYDNSNSDEFWVYEDVISTNLSSLQKYEKEVLDLRVAEQNSFRYKGSGQKKWVARPSRYLTLDVKEEDYVLLQIIFNPGPNSNIHTEYKAISAHDFSKHARLGDIDDYISVISQKLARTLEAPEMVTSMIIPVSKFLNTELVPIDLMYDYAPVQRDSDWEEKTFGAVHVTNGL